MIERSHRMFAPFPPGRLLNVRFEAVQAEPDAQIRRLIQFIDPGLEDEDWLREAVHIPRRTPSRFAELGAEDRAMLTDGCRPRLERLGYHSDARQARRSPASATERAGLPLTTTNCEALGEQVMRGY